jgi:hypothetical protein
MRSITVKISRIKNEDERRVLTGMIVDTTVLGRIEPKWTDQMFKSSWANRVASWCIKYFRGYAEAPKGEIAHLCASWASKSDDQEGIALVERFLASLSDEYESLAEESNSDYVLDIACLYFNRVQVEKLADAIQGDVEIGDVDGALERVNSFGKVEMGFGEGIDVFHDKEAIREALADKRDPLIQYPGDLGEFFGSSFERDGFIAFLGPEKRGKTFWLMDVAYRAMCQRKKTAFFAVGDMTQGQMLRRFLTRLVRRPLFPGKVEYPIAIDTSEDTTDVATESRKYKERVTLTEIKEACRRLRIKKIKSKNPYLKMSVHPNSSLSVSGLNSVLESWEKDDWIPDVIVIDYADILDMHYRDLDGRESINETWKQLRRLSQERHCLVVTATQADARSYTTGTMDMSNFSEDKRKMAHVTGMIGLNQKEDEQDFGVMRLNWVGLREGAYNAKTCVHVATCLEIANPAVRSSFKM